MDIIENQCNGLFDPQRWGLREDAVSDLGERLYRFWARYHRCFRTRTRDPSENAYTYLRAQLTMDTQRNFANMERRVTGGDGQALQHFMSNSPWEGRARFGQIQAELKNYRVLAHGSVLILDESADEKAGADSLGASRQPNGRMGKVDLCRVDTCLAYTNRAIGFWTWVDGELFLSEAWFSPAFAERRQKLGMPSERSFESKPSLGLKMIRRVKAAGLAFELVACDTRYGRNRALRAALEAEKISYAADVPADSPVYLKPPRVGVPRKRHRQGRAPTRLKVLSSQRAHAVRARAGSAQTPWQRMCVRQTERGCLEADCARRRVWTLTAERLVRTEWWVIRRSLTGELTYTLLNGSDDTPTRTLIERSCQRYFAERTFEDAKTEIGWDEFQAQT